jgi:hypothetical protein
VLSRHGKPWQKESQKERSEGEHGGIVLPLVFDFLDNSRSKPRVFTNTAWVGALDKTAPRRNRRWCAAAAHQPLSFAPSLKLNRKVPHNLFVASDGREPLGCGFIQRCGP